MTKAELVAGIVADESCEADVSEADVEQVVDSLIEGITGALQQGDTVHLGPLGTFIPRHEGEHETFMPGSDEEKVVVPAQVRVLFHPSAAMKEQVNTPEDE